MLVHWCRSDIATEKVEIRERWKISLAEFCELFPDKVDEDVRYVVFAEMPRHQGLAGRRTISDPSETRTRDASGSRESNDS